MKTVFYKETNDVLLSDTPRACVYRACDGCEAEVVMNLLERCKHATVQTSAVKV